MSTLREDLDEYLAMRRALGFQLDKLELLAGGFVDWLAAHGQTGSFTINDAVTWARLPAQAAPVWWGIRLGAVRTFAAYQHTRDNAVPLLPADPSTITALNTYRDLPARRHARPAPAGPLFVTRHGTGYQRSTIELYFQRLTRAAGLQPRGRATPRLHDLRHSFATTHIAAAYRAGTDPQRTLTLLATWLGHTSPAHTYWYVSATPELMALAAARLAARPQPGEGTPR